MATVCRVCGEKLSLTRKLTGQDLCPKCSSLAQQERKSAEEEYKASLQSLLNVDTTIQEVESRLPQLINRAEFSDERRTSLNKDFLKSYLEKVLEDDYLTADEEQRLDNITGILGVNNDVFKAEYGDWIPRLIVARVNDGRLPVLDNAHIILKKSEVAHLDTNAQLMKEVVQREWRGGYSGVSFRIAKGVRYHTGGTRGRSVVVGTKIEASDSGILTVTSQRVVFSGSRQSIEMAYAKLINVSVFNDGIQIHVSNRKTPPLFKLSPGLGHVVAATINTACQKLAA